MGTTTIKNSIFTISPYRYYGGWVFDDTHGKEVDMDEVEELLENIQNLRDCEIGNYDVHVREYWRWIRIGCEEEDSRFSPDG